MEKIELSMLRTIVSNLRNCTSLPEDCDDIEDLDTREIIHFVKNVQSKIKDNVNMIDTIIINNSDAGPGTLLGQML
jgi:hypothetical protein